MPVSWNKDAKWQGFDKNKQNINTKGQPRKWIALVNEQLEAKWYKPATKQDIEVNYMNLMNLTQEELLEMWKDSKQPMLVRVCIKNLLWGKGFDVIEKMLDRWIGKAIQKQENDVNIKWELTLWGILQGIQAKKEEK